MYLFKHIFWVLKTYKILSLNVTVKKTKQLDLISDQNVWQFVQKNKRNLEKWEVCT